MNIKKQLEERKQTITIKKTDLENYDYDTISQYLDDIINDNFIEIEPFEITDIQSNINKYYVYVIISYNEENRFKDQSLTQITNDGWFGDDNPKNYTDKEYIDYINDLPRIFPEANLNKTEIKYLLGLKNLFFKLRIR